MDVLGLVILLLVGLVLGWLLLVGFTTYMLLHPPRLAYGWAVARSLPGDPSELRIPGRPADERIEWTEWRLRHGSGDLPVWDINGFNPSGPVVILTHGWGDSRTTMLALGRVAAALPLVSRLVLWDMPGHGDSGGAGRRGGGCSLGLHEPAALRTLVDRVAGSQRTVVLWGFSLGASVSLVAAENNPLVKAVITEAPYLHPAGPARNVLTLQNLPFRSNLPPALVLGGLLRGRGLDLLHPPRRLIDIAASLEVPLLVIHGDADSISPVSDGRDLASAAANATFVSVPNGQHQTLWFAPETAKPSTDALAAFFSSVQEARPGSPEPSS